MRPAPYYPAMGQAYRRSWIGGGNGYWGPWTPHGVPFSNASALAQFPNTVHSGVFDELHAGPPYRDGGPFNKWAFCTDAALPREIGSIESRIYGTTQYKYVGGLCTSFYPDYTYFPGISNNNFLKLAGDRTLYPEGAHTWGDVSSYGAKAWKRFAPGQTSADLATFLGEFREVPKMLQQTARRFRDLYFKRSRKKSYTFGQKVREKAKTYSGDWLAANFGWLPFLSDLRKFYVQWRKADRVMQFLVNHNGKWVKRGGVMQEVEDVEVLSSGIIPNWAGTYCILGDLYYTAGYFGTRQLRRITTQKVWFEGKFRYYIPNIGSVEWNKTFVQRLFGLRLTPDVVWNLTPWSWLIDWCTNVGDVISNVSGPGLTENLVAKYAYLMGERKVMLSEDKTLSLASGPKTLNTIWSLERKTRSKANPFGFSVSWDNLTPRQWSLLTALGIQRIF